jgi:SAM-dependent methyltransferase
MRINNPEKRLDGFWGKVDRRQNRIIERQLAGKDVLDLGCGYGSTTNALRSMGFRCFGADVGPETVRTAHRRYPGNPVLSANAENLPFPDCSFDAVVLKDALHHLLEQADFTKVKMELLRVLKPRSRIVVVDPNINFMLRMLRKASFHTDEECDVESAVRIVSDLGFSVVHLRYNTVYSLPLSGGYIGVNFVPPLSWVQSFILNSEDKVEGILNKLHIARSLCLRYVVVGERYVPGSGAEAEK